MNQTINDHELWEKVKAGDQSSFKILYQKYYESLCLYSLKIVKNKESAEDVVTEVFILLWDKKESITIEKSFINYLLWIVRNASLKQVKINSNVSFEKIEHVDLSEEDDDILEKEKQSLELNKVIEELPEQRKAILKMAAFEKLSYKEISSKLGVSVNTVKTQISRSYSYIREKMIIYSD